MSRPANSNRGKRPAPFFVVLLLISVVGCAPTVATVAVRSDLAGKVSQSFARGYVSQNDAGEDEIVLIADPIDTAAEALPGTPQPPLPMPIIRQVLSIRLHWRPLARTRSDSPAATNAVLHWYAYGHPNGGPISMVHYVGTGFVRVFPDSGGADVSIANAPLTLADRVGELKDALGTFSLSGEFHVVADPGRFRQAMQDLNAAVAEARPPGQ